MRLHIWTPWMLKTFFHPLLNMITVRPKKRLPCHVVRSLSQPEISGLGLYILNRVESNCNYSVIQCQQGGNAPTSQLSFVGDVKPGVSPLEVGNNVTTVVCAGTTIADCLPSEVLQLKKCISVLFSFSRRPISDRQFTDDIRAWLSHLVI